MWNVECGIRNVECRVASLRIYSKTNRERLPLLCKERWQSAALTERLCHEVTSCKARFFSAPLCKGNCRPIMSVSDNLIVPLLCKERGTTAGGGAIAVCIAKNVLRTLQPLSRFYILKKRQLPLHRGAEADLI